MAFSTFNISELPDDADDDFAIEFTTKQAKIGITLSEDELRGVGQAMLSSADGDMETFDGAHAGEV